MIGSVFICYVDGTDDAFRPPMVSTHVVFAGRRKTVMPIRNCGLLFRLGIQILWKGPMVFWPIALFLSIVWFKFQGWIKIIIFLLFVVLLNFRLLGVGVGYLATAAVFPMWVGGQARAFEAPNTRSKT